MDKFFRVLKNAVCILLVLILALIIFVTISGATGYSVASNSMSPELNKGDVVFVRKTPFEELKVGDVVTVEFKSGDGTYTHRIAEIDYDKKEIRTAGDSTETIDTESAEMSQIRGKVWFSLPLLGYLSLMITNRKYVAILIGAALLVMAISVIFAKSKRKGRGDKNEQNKEV